jgi:hypothetical protein
MNRLDIVTDVGRETNGVQAGRNVDPILKGAVGEWVDFLAPVVGVVVVWFMCVIIMVENYRMCRCAISSFVHDGTRYVSDFEFGVVGKMYL